MRGDPIGLAGGMNLFVYCLNDPVNNFDPDGLKGGGILILIRKVLKKHVGAGDVVGPIIDKIISIPYTPVAIFLYIMSPTDAGDPYLDVVHPPLPAIPFDYGPSDPAYWNFEEYDEALRADPCAKKYN